MLLELIRVLVQEDTIVQLKNVYYPRSVWTFLSASKFLNLFLP